MSNLKVIRVKRNEHTDEEMREFSRNLKRGEMLSIDYTVTEEKYEKSEENGSEEESKEYRHTTSTFN